MPLDGTNYDTPALRAPLLAEMPVVFKPRRNQHRLDYRPVAWSLGTDRELPWTIVTDHYNTGDLSRATAMERIFLGRGLGRLVWQAWNSAAVPTRSPELDQRCPVCATERWLGVERLSHRDYHHWRRWKSDRSAGVASLARSGNRKGTSRWMLIS